MVEFAAQGVPAAHVEPVGEVGNRLAWSHLATVMIRNIWSGLRAAPRTRQFCSSTGFGWVRLSSAQTWLSERIVFDPAVCHGKPVVRGTRIPVANVVGAMAVAKSIAEILADYPSLTEADVRACLEFASRLTSMEAIEAESSAR
jgi:uncharacterized protein (DUF433 family)